MPRKNPRPAAKKRRAKLKVATDNGRVRPSYFREQNQHLSHAGLAMAYLMASTEAVVRKKEAQGDG